MLEGPTKAKSVRMRKGRQTIIDGPFAETKELLAGFNLIEAENIDDAVRIAADQAGDHVLLEIGDHRLQVALGHAVEDGVRHGSGVEHR